MTVQTEEIQQRLGFINRTIDHALRACHSDSTVPDDMRYYVNQLGVRSGQMQQAIRSLDVQGMRQSVDDLARISNQAQHRLHPSDGLNYELRSAVILTHIELSALRHQLD